MEVEHALPASKAGRRVIVVVIPLAERLVFAERAGADDAVGHFVKGEEMNGRVAESLGLNGASDLQGKPAEERGLLLIISWLPEFLIPPGESRP